MTAQTARGPGTVATLTDDVDAATDLLRAPCYTLRAECDEEAIAGLLFDLGPGRLLVTAPCAPRGMTREWASRVLADCVRDGRIRVPDHIAARIERGEGVRPC